MRRPPVPAIGIAIVAIVAARAAPAQARSCQNSKADSSAASVQWAPPLDRVITMHATDLSLRNALDRVAAAARLKLSYTTELLPVDTAVCLDANGEPAGRVLRALLRGTNIAATAVGGDQVVLTPRAAGAPATEPDPDMATSMGVLDRVVVTGSANGAPERELAVSVDVVDGKRLAHDNGNTLSDALDSYVPGMWGWTQSPSSMLGSFASIRGASSFGLSYPKIYIDGIEVANPLLITHFNPGSVDHIEVIRGPQGSALYGVDAISGVVNIVTRQEGAASDGTHALVRVSGGTSQSAFARGVMTQDHAFSLATGSTTRSADLNIAGGSIGSFVSNGYSRDLMAAGSARIVGQQTSLTSSARFFTETAGTPNNPLFPRLSFMAPGEGDAGGANGGRVNNRMNAGKPIADTALASVSAAPQSVSEYTLGTTATFAPEGRWTHSIVAGVDGYSLSNVQTNVAPIVSAADKALMAAEGDAARGTLRASSVLALRANDPTRLTLTFAAERAALHLSTPQETQPLSTPDRLEHLASMAPSQIATPTSAAWQNNAGLTTQANAALANTFFATAGVRLESDSRFAGPHGFEAMPMVGGAAVEDYGPFTLKVRASYGKGVRPPNTASRSQLWQTSASNLQKPLNPEEQSGTEAGFDVYFKHALSLQITRFDQLATNLIQDVAVTGDTVHRMAYIAQNVGNVSNRGWEIQSSANLSRLTATGALTFVSSRVEALTKGYMGDLQSGDRMLDVPATTASLAFNWTASRWYATVVGSQALNWINYDEAAIAQAYAANPQSRDFVGDRLRQYWRTYEGRPRIRATMSHDVRDMFAVDLSVDNLLNYQTGEPDNVTIVPGRTIVTGVRWKF